MSPRASHILSTKLRPPARLAHAIDRPRLTTPLAGELPAVVLVVAGAGFGKTTLIAQCHRHLGHQAVWLSLDRNDQDPFMFVRHLIAGFNHDRTIISRATESFVEGRMGALDVDEVTVRIANDLEKLRDHRVLFLDDYYLAETPELNALVHHLIVRASTHLRVVITSRATPALPIVRYKADNILREVGPLDLAFSLTEADAFLRHTHDLHLAPRELDLLIRHTEGWGAGLQLMSLFLKESRDPKDAMSMLSGDTSDINDYLATEVVGRLSPEIQQFLLYSSILERISADICNALLGRNDAQAMIERIETLGLFLFPLDAHRKWYRYHHLFRDFLRAQLTRQYPAVVPDLYHEACAWFDRMGLHEEAVNMALDACDFELAARLVEKYAIDMIKLGHVPQVARWVQRFPAQLLEQNLRLPLYQCWAFAHMTQVGRAEALLQRVEAAVEALCQGSDEARNVLLAEIHTLRTIVVLFADDIERARTMSAVRFPDAPAYDFLSGCMNNAAGLVALARGEFVHALASSAEAERFHGRAGSPYGVCYSRCVAGLTQLAHGRLSDAYTCLSRAVDDAVRDSGRGSFTAAMPRVLLAMFHYERNALDTAYAILEHDLPLVDECAYVDIRTGGFLVMAGTLGARGQVNAALAYLDQAVTINVEAAFERTCALANSESIRLRLMAGDVAGARRFARHTGIDDAIVLPATWSRVAGLRAISQCRLLIAEGQAQSAIAPLQALVALAKAANRRARKIQILSLLVVALVQLHRRDDAFLAVRRILALGAGEAFLRSILDQGPAVGELFIDFAKDGAMTATLPPVEADYLARICAAAVVVPPTSGTTMPFAAGSATAVMVNGVAESVTDRELKVLRLLAEGSSNTRIGATLFISVNTVRWHVANILSKLQVENRTQAAAAARMLHLID